MEEAVFASTSSSTIDNIALIAAVVAAVAAVVAALAASWTIKLTIEARRELRLQRRLENRMLVARTVNELRWAANADPWLLGQPLNTLANLLPLAPTLETPEKVSEMMAGLGDFFRLNDDQKKERRAFAEPVEMWAENAGAQLYTEIRGLAETLAKLEGEQGSH